MVKDMAPNISMFHLWIDCCAGEFRPQFVCQSFCSYPEYITLTWNYAEAHYFKGIHLKEVNHILAQHTHTTFVICIAQQYRAM